MANLTKIFNAAWKIAKIASTKFGGSSKLYFVESLKIAYKLAETTFDCTTKCFANIYRLHFASGEKLIVSAWDMSGVRELVEFWGLAGYKVNFIQCSENGDGVVV